MNNHRLIRAGGFLTAANSACFEAMSILGAGKLEVHDHALLLATLFTIETQAKMAREMVTENMKQALLEETKADAAGNPCT